MSSHTAKVEGLEWTEKFVPKKGERLRRANLIDAVLFGSLLITFINKCDRVKITCQSIVIGSMVGIDPDGAYKQTTFYPFQHASTYADGVTLRSALDSPLKKTDGYGDQPFIQTAAVYNDEEGMVTVFTVNLSPRESTVLECNMQFDKAELVRHIQMHDDQPLAVNTFKNPDRIVPRDMEITEELVLPPLSWNVLSYKVE